MKKLIGFRRVAIGAAVVTAMVSMTAFAETGVGAGKPAAMPVATEEKTDETPEQETVSNYQLVKGTIYSIQTDEDSTRIEITNDDMGMVFNIADNVFILDHEGNHSALTDLKEGMAIAAVIPSNAPVTLSIPPMTSGAIGFVVMSEGMNIDLSKYNDELVNAQNSLKLNMDEKVSIVDVQGSKVKYDAEDLKNKELLVIYGASTRSIPAQTTPDFVMIMATEEEADASQDAAQEPENSPSETKAEELTPATKVPATSEAKEICSIREEAEGKGYTVVWTSHTEPVVLEKGDVKIEVKIGSNEYTVNGEMKFLKEQVRLSEGVMVTGGDFITVLESAATNEVQQ